MPSPPCARSSDFPACENAWATVMKRCGRTEEGAVFKSELTFIGSPALPQKSSGSRGTGGRRITCRIVGSCLRGGIVTDIHRPPLVERNMPSMTRTFASPLRRMGKARLNYYSRRRLVASPNADGIITPFEALGAARETGLVPNVGYSHAERIGLCRQDIKTTGGGRASERAECEDLARTRSGRQFHSVDAKRFTIISAISVIWV
jgi:hypothetical protein